MRKVVIIIMIATVCLMTGCGRDRTRYTRVLDVAAQQNQAFDSITNADSIAKAVRFFDAHGTANERLRAHYLLGCAYRDAGEAPQAVDCYLDAVAAADTTAKDCDFHLLETVYSQMADIFHHQLLLSNEIEARNKASHFAIKANEIKWYIYNLEKSANAYILMNKKDSAEAILDLANSLYLQHNLVQDALRLSKSLMCLYIDSPHKLLTLKKLLDKYDAESEFFDINHELPPSKRQFYFYKGKYFEGINQLDSAEYYYRKVYRPNMTFAAQDPMYRGLLSVFAKRHQADSIAKYAQLYCLVNDSSIAKKDQEMTAQMVASYNYTRYQKVAMENEARANRIRFMLLAITSILIISSIVFWNRFQRIKKQKLQELAKLTSDYNNAIETYKKNLNTLQILDNAHQGVIANIQQELARRTSESDAYRTKLNEVNCEFEATKMKLTKENEQLTTDIKRLEQQKGTPHHLENSELLMNSDIVKRLKKLEATPLSSLKEKDWVDLNREIANTFTDLFCDINNLPKNTKQKTRVCFLVALKIQDSCIANWLELKAPRVSNINSELNQELFNDNSARTLYSNLRQKYNLIPSSE